MPFTDDDHQNNTSSDYAKHSNFLATAEETGSNACFIKKLFK